MRGGLLDLRASGAGSGRFVEAERILTGPPGMDFGLQALRHGEDPRRLDIPFGSAGIAGMALSVDAVWWAARAGGMRASMLASAPAWRQVDPLSVLGRERRRAEHRRGRAGGAAVRRDEHAAHMFGDRASAREDR